ncbi:MAG: hypothetical protein RML40_08770 [Bacteroidota bacterium]|nr:hypothetical protein [Candidatus Kapabacteria bacterium]MDW8220609.1 hypothetical protein [Bacteroidota bacterium]
MNLAVALTRFTTPTLRLHAIILYTVLVVAPLKAQYSPIPTRNLDICDSLVRESAYILAKQLRAPLFPQDTVAVLVVQHEAAWMLESALFRLFQKARRYQAPDSASHYTRLVVRITDLATRYFTLPQDVDIVAREISCQVFALVETHDGIVQPLEPISRKYYDTISRQHVSLVENKQYAFTAGTLPAAPPNFWRHILEPAIITLAGALVVALFFFVRTQ